MSPIQKLAPEVSATIAAGEVVERPSSVVKELVENSLDAGATRISIDVVDGGRAMIRVEDNGAGIPAPELPLAVESFATSKIAAVDDISHVRTLGFRGEALASIRAVSHFTIRSAARGAESGRELAFRGDARGADRPAAHSPGTEVVVENLFFNLPARKKFLRSGPSELRRILGILQAYALAFPETAFSLRENGRDVASYAAAAPPERAEAVLGGDIFKHLVSFERSAGSIRVHGFASLPDLTRANRYMQFLYVNGRHVRDRVLAHAVNQAYQSQVPGDRFPVVVCFIELAPEDVDINVHPAKAEIRFRNESEVHGAVAAALQGALEARTLSYREKVESIYSSIFPGSPERRFEPQRYDMPARWLDAQGPADAPQELGEMGSPPELHEGPAPLFGDEQMKAALSGGALYWQLHQSFILVQIRGGMVIIDQHAAHERILFNRAERAMRGEKQTMQPLLFPATLELTPDEYERFEELGPTLAALGFEAEPFGLRSIIVRAIPAGVKNWGEGRLIEEILGGEGARSVDDFLKTYACRSAIKAGTKLAPEEMESLADELFGTDRPYTCPHGRPTMLRVGMGELERRFQRTVSSRT